jgi:hypothetical protein
VVDYPGLWGNDTDDPFGGERGPAGPRYERNGSVRQSWGDVVGWAGLSKVAPNEGVAEKLIGDRLQEIDAEEASIAARFDAERTRLRVDLASGVAVTDDEERRLDDLAAERVRVHDGGRRLRRRLTDPPPPPGRRITCAIDGCPCRSTRDPDAGSCRSGRR